MIVGGLVGPGRLPALERPRVRLLPALLRGRAAPALPGLPALSCGSCEPAGTTSPSWWPVGLFALALAADLHYTQYFGVVGRRHPLDRIGLALGPGPHHLPGAVRGGGPGRPALRPGPAIRGAALAPGHRRSAWSSGVVATMWYLIAVWTGSDTGHASDLYQPVAFLWFTAAVAALECGTWAWYRRQVRRADRPRPLAPRLLGRVSGRSHRRHLLLPRAVLEPDPHRARRRGHRRHTSGGPAWSR